MSPNILFVGGAKGSWRVRGVQVATALGARCTQAPTRADWRWADVIVLVKHAIDRWGETATQTHCPVIWDALDFWRQPEDNGWTREQCIENVNTRKVRYRISTVIAATQAMAEDIGGVYLPHHYRAELAPTPPREHVEVVAYDGTPKYLGAWRPAMERACAERGWRVVVNPPSLTEADVVVALRDRKWDGWACRRWKSGVKYVNAVAAGRPVVTQASAAVDEINPVHTLVTAPEDIGPALDRITPDLREQAYQLGRTQAPRYGLRAIAHQYRALVASALQVAA